MFALTRFLWVTLINPLLLPEGTNPLKWGEKGKERSLGVHKSLGKARGFLKQMGIFMFSLTRRQHSFHVLTSLYHQVRDWRRSEETCLLNRFQSLSHRMWLSKRDHKPNQRLRCALTHSYSKPDGNLGVKAPITFYLCRCWETQMSHTQWKITLLSDSRDLHGTYVQRLVGAQCSQSVFCSINKARCFMLAAK